MGKVLTLSRATGRLVCRNDKCSGRHHVRTPWSLSQQPLQQLVPARFSHTTTKNNNNSSRRRSSCSSGIYASAPVQCHDLSSRCESYSILNANRTNSSTSLKTETSSSSLLHNLALFGFDVFALTAQCYDISQLFPIPSNSESRQSEATFPRP